MNIMLILLMPSTEVTKGVKLRFSALLWITSKNSHEGFQETFTKVFSLESFVSSLPQCISPKRKAE